MSNLCRNIVFLENKNMNATAEIMANFNSGNFFSSIVPPPNGLNDQALDEFKRQNWGCPGDLDPRFAYSAKWLSKKPSKIMIEFDALWLPPVGIYTALESSGFAVTAYYLEESSNLAGVYRNGKNTPCSVWNDEEYPDGLADVFNLKALGEPDLPTLDLPRESV